VSSVSTPSLASGVGAFSALKAVAGIELWVMGMVMVFPVRLSITVIEFSAFRELLPRQYESG
jgi:hypothetical protein